jgi:SAM-dependent methyltransferase
LPNALFDFTWCRWVLCFLSDPELAIKKIARITPPGGRAIFHEYGHYTTWKFFPRREALEEFRSHVIAIWRESGGEPDIGLLLPNWLTGNGFAVHSIEPRIYCLRPTDYMWQWPSQFIQIHLERLEELGRIDAAFSEKVRADLTAAEREEVSFMLTPLVLEIVAEKI